MTVEQPSKELHAFWPAFYFISGSYNNTVTIITNNSVLPHPASECEKYAMMGPLSV